ncbi:MAG: RtcB family protein [Phycisphaerae bacterium]|jgi:tRNA-splicing ligase RtcB
MKIFYPELIEYSERYSLPVKVWTDTVEESAMDQIRHLSALPFAFHHVAIMPDVHMGYGMPIGGVLATEGVVIPNAVGVDIGCGMCAVETSLASIAVDDLKAIMGEIRKAVPVGFSHHAKAQDESLMPQIKEFPEMPIIGREYASALKQIGTLGGGNHFIEIQKGSDDHIWIMIHSGSRNLGKQVADYYNKKAVAVNAEWLSPVPKEWQLAFLPIENVIGMEYLAEMDYCVKFALANRKLMMDVICGIFYQQTGCDFKSAINIAHNYAAMENHFGRNVMIHRKGATLARDGTIGIIPGSMGSKSYIVRGKGNPDSFTSCSHGAGRKMSRTQAIMELSLVGEIETLEKQGIIHGIRNEKDLDEATGAYKSIDEVMANQSDLVEVLVELKPIGVIKG